MTSVHPLLPSPEGVWASLTVLPMSHLTHSPILAHTTDKVGPRVLDVLLLTFPKWDPLVWGICQIPISLGVAQNLPQYTGEGPEELTCIWHTYDCKVEMGTSVSRPAGQSPPHQLANQLTNQHLVSQAVTSQSVCQLPGQLASQLVIG